MAGKDQLVEIQVPDLAAVQRRMKGLESKAPTAMKNAINKTITHVNKLMSDEARKEYIVKAGSVKKTIRVSKATVSNISASAISSSSDKIKLAGFKVSPASARPKSPPAFYKSKVKQKTGLKALSGSGDRSCGFVATMVSGHKDVFQRQLGTTRKSGKRKGRKRDEKIAELTGLSIPSMLGSKKLSGEVQDKGQQFMHKALDQEIRRMMEANP